MSRDLFSEVLCTTTQTRPSVLMASALRLFIRDDVTRPLDSTPLTTR